MPQATRTRPLSVIYVQRPRNAAIQTYQMRSLRHSSVLASAGAEFRQRLRLWYEGFPR